MRKLVATVGIVAFATASSVVDGQRTEEKCHAFVSLDSELATETVEAFRDSLKTTLEAWRVDKGNIMCRRSVLVHWNYRSARQRYEAQVMLQTFGPSTNDFVETVVEYTDFDRTNATLKGCLAARKTAGHLIAGSFMQVRAETSAERLKTALTQAQKEIRCVP